MTEDLHTKLLSYADQPNIPSSLKKYRKKVLEGLYHGIKSVLPHTLISQFCRVTSKNLIFGDINYPIEEFNEIILIGGGKATASMTSTFLSILDSRIPIKGCINVPIDQQNHKNIKMIQQNSAIRIQFARHPIPNQKGVEGVKAMLDLIQHKTPRSLILVLLSGGGSALLPYPVKGISLADLQKVNQLLLECGANIHEINCVRKHLSQFKGGRLVEYFDKNIAITLIISDVVGDDLQSIASGPTVADSTSFQDSVEICKRYNIYSILPDSVRSHLDAGLSGDLDETPKPGSSLFSNVHNYIIGSAKTARNMMKDFFQNRGFPVEVFSSQLTGEASDYGRKLARRLSSFTASNYPAIFIGTGEFTVTLQGNGIGGRNQEMLTAFLQELTLNPDYQLRDHNFIVIGVAFDGIEGNSPSMGAILDSSTLSRIKKLGLNLQTFLDLNDTYHLFTKLGDSLVVGPTGTNVNDMLIVMII